MEIQIIVNQPVSSNCYVLYEKVTYSCLIIDPGTESCEELLEFINSNHLRPKYVIITHEHFDHIWGVNRLREVFNFELIASEVCNNSIKDEKKNLSFYFQYPGFCCSPADIVFQEKLELQFGNELLYLMETPGHSPGGLCIKVRNYLFTGDTLIPNEKTVTKLPLSNKEHLKTSLDKIQYWITYPVTLFPGHSNYVNLESSSDFKKLK